MNTLYKITVFNQVTNERVNTLITAPTKSAALRKIEKMYFGWKLEKMEETEPINKGM